MKGFAISQRNRYQNIDPWNYNRVKLRIDHDGENDYINASNIKLLCHASGVEKRYIATQVSFTAAVCLLMSTKTIPNRAPKPSQYRISI